MFCPGCGVKTEEGAMFCENCGSRIIEKRSSITPNQSNLISTMRHPKESFYFLLGGIISSLIWLALIWLIFLFFWVVIPALIGLWIAEQYFKSNLLGNSIRVSRGQYPEIFEILETQCKTVNINKCPEIFIINSQGKVNAIAVKLLKTKYILLYSFLIDAMLSHNSMKELSAIIGHELGHHAAGHTALWKHYLLGPARLVPFFVPAYSRACELTADRIGAFLCGDKGSAKRALITLACGSLSLSPKLNIDAFKQQENQLSKFFAFLNDMWANHPRITKRVLALDGFHM